MTIESHYIEQIQDRIKDIVVVGACDGILCDYVTPFIDKNPHWRSYLIEPVRSLYMDLVYNFGDRDNVILINSALRKSNGVMNINTIDRNQQDEMPSWAPGISSFHNNAVVESLQDYIIQEAVQTITVDKFVRDYNIQNIDVLQIDVEGDDYEVLRDFWALGFRPKVMKIEIKNCYDNELETMYKLFRNNDYQTFVQGEDVVAISNTL